MNWEEIVRTMQEYTETNHYQIPDGSDIDLSSVPDPDEEDDEDDE